MGEVSLKYPIRCWSYAPDKKVSAADAAADAAAADAAA
jgi:hypothetical protein